MDEREHNPSEIAEETAIEDREAVADGMNRQDHRTEKNAAESRPTFGDDQVTPRLNDGR